MLFVVPHLRWSVDAFFFFCRLSHESYVSRERLQIDHLHLPSTPFFMVGIVSPTSPPPGYFPSWCHP